MPYTGFDPQAPGALPDASGGGLDQSYYYALSPGGRFPGDTYFATEYSAALDRGTTGANPNYDMPSWLLNVPGRIGQLARAHYHNVTTGGEGQQPSMPGGYPYHLFSGPAAGYGPPGGPLHGLVDQGRAGFQDGPDRRPPGSSDPAPPPRRGGGGGGGAYTFTPYQQGSQFQGSFVGMDPIAPFTAASTPTQFVGGRDNAFTTPSPVSRTGGNQPGRQGAGAGAGGQQAPRTGRWRGQNRGGGAPVTPGQQQPPRTGGRGAPLPPELEALLRGSGGLAGALGRPTPPGGNIRPQVGSPVGGMNTGNLDRGTPSWTQDPTQSSHYAGGFPGPTPTGPGQPWFPTSSHGLLGNGPSGNLGGGESFDEYVTRLHDAGFDNETISSLVGPYGFSRDDAGSWQWNWGTGPVMRGPDGYTFARNLSGGGAGAGGAGGQDAVSRLQSGRMLFF